MICKMHVFAILNSGDFLEWKANLRISLSLFSEEVPLLEKWRETGEREKKRPYLQNPPPLGFAPFISTIKEVSVEQSRRVYEITEKK